MVETEQRELTIEELDAVSGGAQCVAPKHPDGQTPWEGLKEEAGYWWCTFTS